VLSLIREVYASDLTSERGAAKDFTTNEIQMPGSPRFKQQKHAG